jgi:hypothetical protein
MNSCWGGGEGGLWGENIADLFFALSLEGKEFTNFTTLQFYTTGTRFPVAIASEFDWATVQVWTVTRNKCLGPIGHRTQILHVHSQ